MKDDYSVSIKGMVEFKESENSTSVAIIKFGIVVHDCDSAFNAVKSASCRLCENLNISQGALQLTHIDIVPVDER